MTRSSENRMGAGREIRITVGKMKRGNDRGITMSLTSSCGGRMRPNGGRATARTEQRKKDTIMAIPTVLTVETR